VEQPRPRPGWRGAPVLAAEGAGHLLLRFEIEFRVLEFEALLLVIFLLVPMQMASCPGARVLPVDIVDVVGGHHRVAAAGGQVEKRVV